jgi:hypothetical protein
MTLNHKSLNFIFGKLGKSIFDFLKKPELTATEIKKAKKLFEDGNIKAMDIAASSGNSDLLRAMADTKHSDMQTKHWAAIFGHNYSDKRWSKDTKKQLLKDAGNKIYNDPEFFEHLKSTPNGIDNAVTHAQTSVHLRPQDLDYIIDKHPELHSRVAENNATSKQQLKKIIDSPDDDNDYLVSGILRKHPDLAEHAAFSNNPSAQRGYLRHHKYKEESDIHKEKSDIPEHIFSHLNEKQDPDTLRQLSMSVSDSQRDKFIESHIHDPAFENYSDHVLNALTPEHPSWNTVMTHAQTKPYLISKLSSESLKHVPASLKGSTISGMGDNQLNELLSNDISKEDIDQVLKNKNFGSEFVNKVAEQKSITPEQTHQLVQHIDSNNYRKNYLVNSILGNEKLLPETFKELKSRNLVDSSNSNFYHHPDLPRDILDESLNHADPTHRAIAAGSPSLTKDELSKLTKDKNKAVRLSVISNPNLNSEHIATLLGDKVKDVRDLAIHHPNAHWGQLENHWNKNKETMDWRETDRLLKHPNLPLSVAKEVIAGNTSLHRFENHPQYHELVSHVIQNGNDLGALHGIFDDSKKHSPEEIAGAFEAFKNHPNKQDAVRFLNRHNSSHPLAPQFNEFLAEHDPSFYTDKLRESDTSKEEFDNIFNKIKGRHDLVNNLFDHFLSSDEQKLELINSHPLEAFKPNHINEVSDPVYHALMAKTRAEHGNSDKSAQVAQRMINNGLRSHPAAGPYTQEIEKEYNEGNRSAFHTKFLANNGHASDDYIVDHAGDFDFDDVMTPELAERIAQKPDLWQTDMNPVSRYLQDPLSHAAKTDNPSIFATIVRQSKITPEELGKLEEMSKTKKFNPKNDLELDYRGRIDNAIKRRKEELKSETLQPSEENKIDYSDAHNILQPYTDTTEIHVHPGVERLKHLKGMLLDQSGGDENKLVHKKTLPGSGDGLPKELFNSQGHTSAAVFENYIKSLPKHKFLLSYDHWNGMQQHQPGDQLVMQLNTTDEMIQKLKDEGVYDMFKGIAQSSHRSGHPVRNHTIGWSRIDTSQPNHFAIDEIQSDLGQSVTHQIKAMKEGSPRKQKQTLFHMGAQTPEEADDKIKKIQSIVSGGFKTPNHAIHAAVHELARQKGIKTTSMDTLEDQKVQSGVAGKEKTSGFMIETYKNQPAKDGYKEGEKSSVMPNHQSNHSKAQIRKLVKSFGKLVELANLYLKDIK